MSITSMASANPNAQLKPDDIPPDEVKTAQLHQLLDRVRAKASAREIT
jgi:hypothetical protein